MKLFYEALFTKTRKFNSHDYSIRVPIDFIPNDEKSTVDDMELKDDSTLVVEVSKFNGWAFKKEDEPDDEQCEFCRN